MRGDPSSMVVSRPRTLREALDLLARHPDAVPLAGGTDFMVSWNAGSANGRRILELSSIGSLRAMRKRANGVTLGALMSHWRLRHDPRIRERFPLLAQACATIGGRQIQTRGTLGGNIANASPAGDTLPPLAVYEARVRLASSSGRRTIGMTDVFVGVKKTALRDDELIHTIEIDYPATPHRSLFRKVGTRAASAISKVVAAGLLWRDREGRIRELRFALGSMAPTVKRLSSVESFVAGKKLTSRVVNEAVELVDQDVAPIDDLRSTRQYRLTVSRNLLRAFLSAAEK